MTVGVPEPQELGVHVPPALLPVLVDLPGETNGLEALDAVVGEVGGLPLLEEAVLRPLDLGPGPQLAVPAGDQAVSALSLVLGQHLKHLLPLVIAGGGAPGHPNGLDPVSLRVQVLVRERMLMLMRGGERMGMGVRVPSGHGCGRGCGRDCGHPDRRHALHCSVDGGCRGRSGCGRYRPVVVYAGSLAAAVMGVGRGCGGRGVSA